MSIARSADSASAVSSLCEMPMYSVAGAELSVARCRGVSASKK